MRMYARFPKLSIHTFILIHQNALEQSTMSDQKSEFRNIENIKNRNSQQRQQISKANLDISVHRRWSLRGVNLENCEDFLIATSNDKIQKTSLYTIIF